PSFFIVLFVPEPLAPVAPRYTPIAASRARSPLLAIPAKAATAPTVLGRSTLLTGPAHPAAVPRIPCFPPPASCRPANLLRDLSSSYGNGQSADCASRSSSRLRIRHGPNDSCPESGTLAGKHLATSPGTPFGFP